VTARPPLFSPRLSSLLFSLLFSPPLFSLPLFSLPLFCLQYSNTWCGAWSLHCPLNFVTASVPPLELRAELVLDSVGSLTLLPKTQMHLHNARTNKQNAHCLLVFEICLTKRASHGKSYRFRTYQREELLQCCWLCPSCFGSVSRGLLRLIWPGQFIGQLEELVQYIL